MTKPPLDPFRHTAPITALKLTHDGKLLIASGGGGVTLFSTKTGEALRRTAHEGLLVATPSPDDTSLFINTRNSATKLSLQTLEVQQTIDLPRYTDPHSAMVLSPNGDALVCFERTSLSLYHWSTKKKRAFDKSYNLRTNIPERVAFSPNGKLFTTAPRARYLSNQQSKKRWPITLWSAATGKILKTLNGHDFALCDVAFSPDNKQLASIDRNGVLCLFSLATQKPLWRFYSGAWAYQPAEEEHRIAFSPDGKWIMLSLDARLLCLINAKTGEAVWRTRRAYLDKISPVVFSHDSTQIFVGDGARIRVLSTIDGSEESPPAGCLGPVSRVVPASDGSVVVQGERDPNIWRISANTARQVLYGGQHPSVARSSFDGVDFTIISGDASTIARLDIQGGGFLFSAQTGELICRLTLVADDRLHAAALSFDGKYAALVITRGSTLYPHTNKDTAKLSLFSVETGCITKHLAEGKLLDALKNPVFSDDGRFIACVNRSQILLFDLTDGQTHVLHENLGNISSACFSRDSTSLVALDESRMLVQWSLPEVKIKAKAFAQRKEHTLKLRYVEGDIAAITTEKNAFLFDLHAQSIEAIQSESPVTAICGPWRGHADGSVSPTKSEQATQSEERVPPTKIKEVSAAKWLASFEKSIPSSSTSPSVILGQALARAKRRTAGDPSGVSQMDPRVSATLRPRMTEKTKPEHDRAEAEVLACIEQMPQAAAQDEDVLRRVRSLLSSLWAERGVTKIHQAMSKKLLSLLPWRWHNDQRVPSHIETVALRRDGRYLAIGSNCGYNNNPGGTIQIYEMATGQCVQTIPNILWGLGQGRGSGDQDRMRWSPDGKLIGSSFNQDGVAVFDPFVKQSHMRAIPHYTGNVDSGPAWCFVNDREVMIGFEVNEGWPRGKYAFLPLSIYNIEESPHMYRPLDNNKPIKGFDKETPIDWAQWMDASIDGKKLCVSARKPAMVLDAKTGEILFKQDGSDAYHSRGALFSPDANWYYQSTLYSTKDGKEHTLEVHGKDSRWSPDSKILAIADKEDVYLYSPSKRRVLASIPCDIPKHVTDANLGDSGVLAFSPDSQYLAVREAEQISVWNITGEPKELTRIKPTQDVVGLALGEGAQTLACWSRDHVELWHVGTNGVSKRLNAVTWTDEHGQYYQDEAGHPLSCAGGNAANLFERDPSFPVPGEGWITAFETGLIVCPPQLRGVLSERLSLVLGDWFSWPLSWALDLFLVADELKAAFAEERFPKKLLHQKWEWSPLDISNGGMGMSASGFGPTYTLGWYAPETEYTIKDAKHAEEILRLLGGKLVRVEVDASWSDKVKSGVPYEFNSEYAMIGLNTKDGGGGSSVNYKDIRKVSALRFRGHPEDAITPAKRLTLLSLEGKRVALANLTWSKKDVTEILNKALAIIVEMNDSPELIVVQDPYGDADRKALLAKVGLTKSISYASLQELTRMNNERSE